VKFSKIVKGVNPFVGALALCTVINPAVAVTLPSRMPAFAKSYDAVDAGFASWMNQYVNQPSIDELTSKELIKWLSGKEPAERALILLELRGRAKVRRASYHQYDQKLKSEYEKTLKNLPKIFSKSLESTSGTSSVVLQQLFLEWQSRDKKAADSSGFEPKVFDGKLVATCAAKSRDQQLITRDAVAKMSDAEILNLLKVSDKYQSESHRRRYIESILLIVPDDKKSGLSGPIRELVRQMPIVLARYPWLQDVSSKNLPESIIFSGVMSSVRRKKCQEAERLFEQILVGSQTKIEEASALSVGANIDRCYRAERRSSPQEFWKRINPAVEKKLGKLGSLWVRVRLGYLRWAGNDLVESRRIFKELNDETKEKKSFRVIEAKSIYYLGKIAEDDHDLELANSLFANYVERFQDLEDFESALKSLVVLKSAQKKWGDVTAPLENYLASQSLIHMDSRPASVMAFSLFWLGRAKLEMGDIDIALELWRRLAAEYYSTFYGAMGHYLLEQGSGNSYAIEPARTRGFDFRSLTSAMSKSSQEASDRALKLLSLRLPRLSRCEADEIVPVNSEDYDTLLVRSLIFHATGSWLDAIKIYDAIPRSVRNGLPIGFERVLFPRKYDEIVKSRALKLGVDPDFVFALMRQESVFAKDATSPVGAVGLMQLMPATARLELNRISPGYVTSDERAKLTAILNNPQALRDPETNVTLGVHHLWRMMELYKSPVFALASYNAGPAPTDRWRKTIATDDWLTFIERIPYKETRAYVKLILRNYFYYKRWYNSPDGRNQIHIDSVVNEVIALTRDPLADNTQ
jgi:tetratricopeptide (TPR) repeat protein